MQYNVIIRCLVRGWETWAEVLVKKVYVTQRQIKKIKKQLCSTEINSCMRNQSAAGACMIYHLFLRANSLRHNTYLFWEHFILVDGRCRWQKLVGYWLLQKGGLFDFKKLKILAQRLRNWKGCGPLGAAAEARGGVKGRRGDGV